MHRFIKVSVDLIFKRVKMVALLNTVYFCSFLISALLSQILFLSTAYYDETWRFFVSFDGEWIIVFAKIFVFNLCFSAFLVVTLPGMILFPLSVVFLVYRAVIWGLFFSPLPFLDFLAVLPTLVLEGEAYVFAAMTGVLVGLSWVKPSLVFGVDVNLSRWNAFKLSLDEGLRLYVWVVMFLFIAAIVEILTLLYF